MSNVQELDSSDLDTSWVAEEARDSQSRLLVSELDFSGRLLLERVTIVDVERASSLAVRARSDDELEVDLPEIGDGHSTLLTKRKDNTTLDVKRNAGEVDVLEGDGRTLTLEWCQGREVVEGILGEVCADGGGVFLGDGGDKDGGAVEELEIDRESVGVLRVSIPQGAQERATVLGASMEASVEVVEQTVTGENNRSAQNDNSRVILALTECR